MKRVGHKGADLIAPGNTRASFEAALEHGVDMIEFDVLPHEGRLVLSHDPGDAGRRSGGLLTLEEGLDLFAEEAFAGVELDVDLKTTGYELKVADALAARGLTTRTLVSSHYRQSLDLLGDSGVKRGWSVPRIKRNYIRSPAAPVAYALARAWRLALPRRAVATIRAGRCEALMVHWVLMSRRLVDAVHREGGEVYVWTVDRRPAIERFESFGVDGVISNDPRLFDPAPA
ncbi:MAG: glycerophosphodiester phosphodiesterase [Thermoleophilaceae bacterium]|nr:glycerophosphodiester phosphodiesterase [Thermoleophilaceae bacterium]